MGYNLLINRIYWGYNPFTHIYQLPWTSKYICPKETTAQSPSRSPSPQKVTSHRQWRTPQLRLVLSSAFKGGLQRHIHMHDFTILLRKPHMLEDVLWLLLIKYAWRFEEPTDTKICHQERSVQEPWWKKIECRSRANNWLARLPISYKGGPTRVVSRLITSISRVITPFTHA